ncbi:MAG: hypothetical protein WC612_00185 [Bdellovibrionales bacterium]|jgi:hypothetical protein
MKTEITETIPTNAGEKEFETLDALRTLNDSMRVLGLCFERTTLANYFRPVQSAARTALTPLQVAKLSLALERSDIVVDGKLKILRPGSRKIGGFYKSESGWILRLPPEDIKELVEREELLTQNAQMVALAYEKAETVNAEAETKKTEKNIESLISFFNRATNRFWESKPLNNQQFCLKMMKGSSAPLVGIKGLCDALERTCFRMAGKEISGVRTRFAIGHVQTCENDRNITITLEKTEIRRALDRRERLGKTIRQIIKDKSLG